MNEKVIWNFLKEKIKNDYGVAGLMGNLYAESSLNPILANGIKKHGLTNQQYTDIADSGVNSSFITDGIAYGLAQWCYHTRKKKLLEKAKAKETSVGNIQLQLEYLWEELQSYKTVLNKLYSATNIKEASDIVLIKYEKPANQSDAVKAKRASYGQKYYDQFHVKAKITIKKSVAKEIKEKLERALK